VGEIPSGRTGHGMAWDEGRDRVVLFGGSAWGAEACAGTLVETDAAASQPHWLCNDLWEWNGEQWDQVSHEGSAPLPRHGGAMVYDPSRESVVLFSGQNLALESAAEADELGDDEENLPAASVVVGQMPWDLWEWDGVGWEEITGVDLPRARREHSLVYDTRAQRAVLFGGRVVDEQGLGSAGPSGDLCDATGCQDTWLLDTGADASSAVLLHWDVDVVELGDVIDSAHLSVNVELVDPSTGVKVEAWNAHEGYWQTLSITAELLSEVTVNLDGETTTTFLQERDRRITVRVSPLDGQGTGHGEFKIHHASMRVDYSPANK
ncbi:MAG: hypothetical protein VYE15_02030, partial [Myxococcota bacterium]|nr:hypothetical protein [Myxococcota bacterium]